jgi:hypothetical protein
MLQFITDKIINDRTSLIITNGNEQDIKLMNRNIINIKLTEFGVRVDDENRPTYTVAVHWYVEDSYDFI